MKKDFVIQVQLNPYLILFIADKCAGEGDIFQSPGELHFQMKQPTPPNDT